MSVFKTDVNVFIGDVIMCFTSDWLINLHMRVTNWLNIFVDLGQFSDPDFISVTHQKENVQSADKLSYWQEYNFLKFCLSGIFFIPNTMCTMNTLYPAGSWPISAVAFFHPFPWLPVLYQIRVLVVGLLELTTNSWIFPVVNEENIKLKKTKLWCKCFYLVVNKQIYYFK
jgi:hypothetical protein